MTTINHAAAGGLLYGWIAWLLKMRDTTTFWPIVVAGAFFGALPDMIGWWETYITNPGSWQLRNVAHDGSINAVFQWTLAYGLHTWLDRFIHPYPEHVALYHAFEAVSWALYALFGYWLFKLRSSHVS